VRFSTENWQYLGNGEEIRPRLLLITNKKWLALRRTKWKTLILDDLEGH